MGPAHAAPKSRRLAGAALVALLSLSDCGGGGDSQATVTDVSKRAETHALSTPPPPAEGSKQGFCAKATVRTAADPNAIAITVRCVPSRGVEPVNFSFRRFMKTSGGPVVAEPGRVEAISTSRARAGNPTCRLIHRSLVCGVRARKPVVLDALVVVEAGTRCSSTASVTSSFDDTCGEKSCAGALTTYRLFQGRPRGC